MTAKRLLTLTVLTGLLAGLTAPAALGQDSYPSEWSSLDVAGLTALAEQYRGQGQDGLANLKLLAGFAAEKYAADSQSGTVDWNQWCPLVNPLGTHLPAATQAAMATDLKQKLIPDQAAAAGLSREQMWSVAETLYRLSDVQSVGPLAVMWVTASENYKSCDARGLGDLGWYISPEGASGRDARLRLIGEVSDRFLTDDATVRQVGSRNWLSFATCLGKDLSDEARAAWVAKLRSAFEITGLTASDLQSLALAVERLGGSAGELATAWVNSGDAWKASDVMMLAELARRLPVSGSAGEQSRNRLAGHVYSTYLSDPAAVRGVNCAAWTQLVRHVGRHLSAETKSQWAEKLESAFTASPEVLAGLKGDDAALLAGCLLNLGKGIVSQGSVVAKWAEVAQEWKTWEPKRLAWLAQKLDWAADAGKASRAALATGISGRFFVDAAATRSMGADHWKQIVTCLQKDFDAQVRALWSSKLRAAYAADAQMLQSLSADQLRCFAGALAELGEARTADLLLDWLDGQQDLTGLSRELATIAGKAAAKDKQAAAQFLSELEESWLTDYGNGQLSCKSCVSISLGWKDVGDLAKARSWAERAYQLALGTEDARAAADEATLLRMSDLLSQVGMVGEGKGYGGYATVLAALGKQGKLSGNWPNAMEWLSLPLGTAQTRQTVRAELVDSEGQPRLVVAKALAWAYRRAGELKAWQAFLDGKIGAAGIGGDTKARWMLARGYAESVISEDRSPLRGKQWLDQALATGESMAMKLESVTELLWGYAAIGRHDAGLSLLDAIAGQFAGTEAAAGAEALQRDIQAAKVKHLAMVQRKAAEAEVQAHKQHRDELQRRLEAARVKGDQEAIGRYERLLGQ